MVSQVIDSAPADSGVGSGEDSGANVPSAPEAKDIESIFRETRTEIEEDAEPEGDETKEPATGDEDTTTTEPKPAEDTPVDPLAEVTPPEPTAQEQSSALLAETVLSIVRDPNLLQAALNEAGVQTLQELPMVRELLGRERQSATDQTRNELARQAWEEQAINNSLVRGRASAQDFVKEMNQLAEDIASGAEEVNIPNEAYIQERFNNYAEGAVTAYHNKNFAQMSEMVYGMPEMANLTAPQVAALEAVNGASPDQWLATHLAVARENLWNQAQNDVVGNAEKIINDQKALILESYKQEVTKMANKHEKELAKSIEDTKKATRAEVMAEFAKNGAPPKSVTQRASGSTNRIDDDAIQGSTIEEIFRSAAAAQRAGKL